MEMAALFKVDLAGIHALVAEQLESADIRLSPEQALAPWGEPLETATSIGPALAVIEAGRTRPADEVLEELRSELRKPLPE